MYVCRNLKFLVLKFLFIFIYFFGGTGVLNSGPAPWATPPALFFVIGFSRQGLTNYLPGLISASWVARITGICHQGPALFLFLKFITCRIWAILPNCSEKIKSIEARYWCTICKMHYESSLLCVHWLTGLSFYVVIYNRKCSYDIHTLILQIHIYTNVTC
jgi:hypothetical protein